MVDNTYNSKRFNGFVRGELRDKIVKRVIVNGKTGSSWYFKRIEKLNVTVAPVAANKLMNKLIN